jgi:predicted TIM-barrel enzyme
MKIAGIVLLSLGFGLSGHVSLAAETPAASTAYDAALAKRLGADERGMRNYVLVVLKTGPTPVTDPEKRKTMFAGHFANMERLAKEGKLVLAGPFDEDPATGAACSCSRSRPSTKPRR